MLPLAAGQLDPKAHAGHYWAIATGEPAALASASSAGLPLVKTPPGALGLIAAQRLGADVASGEPTPLVVLLDPGGTVVQSWADGPLAELLQRARERAEALQARR